MRFTLDKKILLPRNIMARNINVKSDQDNFVISIEDLKMSLIGIPGQLMKIDSDLLAEISKMKKSDLISHIKTTIAFQEKRFDEISLDVINLDKKIVSSLKAGGLKTVDDLIKLPVTEMLLIPGIGKATVKKIIEFFNSL